MTRSAVLLIIAIICVVLIGYLYSMKSTEQHIAVVPAAVIPANGVSSATSYSTTTTTTVTGAAAAPAAGEVDGVPNGAPAPVDSASGDVIAPAAAATAGAAVDVSPAAINAAGNIGTAPEGNGVGTGGNAASGYVASPSVNSSVNTGAAAGSTAGTTPGTNGGTAGPITSAPNGADAVTH